jgi:hypothetical protein
MKMILLKEVLILLPSAVQIYLLSMRTTIFQKVMIVVRVTIIIAKNLQ